ncbi:MAG TPA: alpha/beta hydrolase [Acidobacteriota bacterium]|nr:alpha/beta hydrolase [Acidobacteriota bacterium]
MSTSFAVSEDGVRIAYDVIGSGAPILLLHGGGKTRQDWHTAGYVERLRHEFKVVTIDIRGNGESDKPTKPADYTIENHCQDILTVACACGIEQFSLWGFSYGGNIGRYLAARSPRITSFIMIGVTFGLGASGDLRRWIIDSRDHWLPVLQAQADGTLNIRSLSQQDQDVLQKFNMPATIAWTSGMLEWGSIEPGDILCPTLWLAGSRNTSAMAGIQEYKTALEGSKVQVRIVADLDHMQELTEIDKVLPLMLAFTRNLRLAAQ